ncbi:hypothetical protein SASPL_129645 [Salvia splendens]|uniref:Uncharacterized protein n=1 Tax=Salvia splendens TaxID=180675 RepID=A0A8X8XET2_SALSN|nr:uncharacterized protein LOC121751417 [Salvia splendens]KAG6411562.1 hypothetical protein SASPL_129645 [Salvia splendens]
MAYAYKPTYYTSLHDSMTSICKSILPFSLKKKRMPAIAAAEQQRAKEQSDQLKWQQESFHQMHNLMGLCKEGIIQEDEVSAFRAHLLETLIASPLDYEPPVILRDKLIFLQELLYANCISEDEYHASKRPLLQRLAVQGAEIKETDVTVHGVQKQISNEEWSVIDLKEEKCLVKSASKRAKGASSVLGFVSPNQYGKLKEDKDTSESERKNKDQKGNELLRSTENPFWNAGSNESKSIFLMESVPESEKQVCSEKGKRKPFMAIFQREENDDNNKENGKTVKKTWGFKKWKKGNVEDERTLLSLPEKSDDTKEPQIKKMKNKNGLPADGILDEAFGENVKKELSRIQTELSARSTRVHLSDEVSDSRAVDNAELKKGFPKSSCDHNSQAVAREKRNSKRWTTFDDEDENSHPNLFAPQDQSSYFTKQASRTASRTSFNNSSIDKGFIYNPFFDM